MSVWPRPVSIYGSMGEEQISGVPSGGQMSHSTSQPMPGSGIISRPYFCGIFWYFFFVQLWIIMISEPLTYESAWY